ncbi:MAG TPA: TIGR03564 family F420-dependent LLM class oxidoreductase [Acidimicrobiales bacterium]|nr:TIGR03564 family F420-dependent LLM class oxidoreductase [Acidimicrobiales bacterium]
MRIGLSGGGSSIERIVEQAQEAEADGFTSLWYAGAIGGDPFVPMALAGRATSTIELGTSVVQTYTRHPVLMAHQALAVAGAIGGGRFTLGIGVSHQPVIEQSYGLDYGHPARHMREYLSVLEPLLHGESVSFDGADFRVRADFRTSKPEHPVPVLVAALGTSMLDATGRLAQGTITWMANRRAVDEHVTPLLAKAAGEAGAPAARIVVGLPVAVCSDEHEGRAAAGQQFAMYGTLPNYRRILDIGGADGPADAAIVGDEDAVAGEIRALFDAGATDVWAAIFPVGDDRKASRQRTRALLRSLAAE